LSEAAVLLTECPIRPTRLCNCPLTGFLPVNPPELNQPEASSASDNGAHAATAQVFVPTGDQWLTVLGVMQRLSGSSSLEEVLKAIIDSLRTCLHAERASVFQYDAARRELFISQGHGLAEVRFSIDFGIAGEAARTLGMINVPDCYADPRFNPAIDKKTGFHTRNMLTIPLVSPDGELQGVAQVLNKDGAFGDRFDGGDELTASALGGQAAVAIRRVRFVESELRKNKIEADLQVARKIQQSSWPKMLPTLPGFELFAASLPADETGGDTYDVICMKTLIGPLGHNKALLLMGDATGHGIGPALSVSQLRAMVRMGARLNTDVGVMLAHLNAQACDDLPPGRFITAFLGQLDADAGTITYGSAGQAPILVMRADGSCLELDASAMPLGIEPDQLADDVSPIQLEQGDIFLMISDGYFEASNGAGDLFGNERVIDVIRQARTGKPEMIFEALNSAADSFVQGHPYDDDRTVIFAKRTI